MTRFSPLSQVLATAPPRGTGRLAARLAGRVAAALLALASVPPGARAEEEWVEEEPRWIPSLRLGFDTFEYGTEATVLNGIDPPANSGTQNENSRVFMLDFGGEVMGPMLGDVPGHPRLFVQAGVEFNPFSSDSIFDLGDNGDAQASVTQFINTLAPAKQRNCEFPPPGQSPSCPLQPTNFLGEGSEIDAEFQNWSWSAALGVAFTFPIGDSLLLEVKPSVAYNLDRIDLSGNLTTVLDTGQTIDAPAGETYGFGPRVPPALRGTPVQVPLFEVYQSQASERVIQHSLGPGLELGLVLFRSSRPVRASLYADARFLWLLGGRSTTFSDSVASYEVRRDPYAIRGGAGVRFSWVGFEGR